MHTPALKINSVPVHVFWNCFIKGFGACHSARLGHYHLSPHPWEELPLKDGCCVCWQPCLCLLEPAGIGYSLQPSPQLHSLARLSFSFIVFLHPSLESRERQQKGKREYRRYIFIAFNTFCELSPVFENLSVLDLSVTWQEHGHTTGMCRFL